MSGPQRALSPVHPLPRLPSSPIIPSTINAATIPGGDSDFSSPPGPFNPRLRPNFRTLPPLSALSLPASHWAVPPYPVPTELLPPLPPRDYFPLECYFRLPPSAAIEQARRLPPLVPLARALPADTAWSSLSVFPPPEELPELEFHLPPRERRTQTFTPEQIAEWRRGDSRQRIAAERVEPDASLRLAPLEYHLPTERPHPPHELEAPRRRDTQQTAVAGRAEVAPAVANRQLRELRPQPLEPPVVMDGSVRHGVEKLRSGRPAKKGRVARVGRARHQRPDREDHMEDLEMSGALQ